MEKVLISKKQSLSYSFGKRFKNSAFLILMIIPAIIYYAVFCYAPMYGVLLAFTVYHPAQGIMGSVITEGLNLNNFKYIFELPDFWIIFRNTLLIGTIKVVIAFVSSVVVALLINELRMRFFKKFVQITLTFPHFLSWVVVASIFMLLLSDNGAISRLIQSTTGETVSFLKNKSFFLGLLFSSDVWKEAGWGSIIYIATMAGISPDLYEAADIDGATRLQKIWNITLPGIKATAILLLIMSVGGVLSAGFDQIFNLTGGLKNAMVLDTVNIIDTYIYDLSFGSSGVGKAHISTTIGLFKSLIGFILVIVTDRIAKLCGERGII